MGVAVHRIESQLGRPLSDDDVEPVNRAQVAFARGVSAVDYALALAAGVEFRRAVQQWWSDGLGPVAHTDPRRTPGAARDVRQRSGRTRWPRWRGRPAYVPFTPAFNSSGQPAINLPLHWSSSGLPIGVQLVAGYGREDLLLRVASQVETAQPWAQLRPPGVTFGPWGLCSGCMTICAV